MAEMKTKEQLEQEILKEAQAAAAKESKKEKEKPKAAKKPQAKKKGLIEKATGAIKDLKLPTKKEEKKEAKIVLERVYTVPLRNLSPRGLRTRRSVSILKAFAKKHLKASQVKITKEANEAIWAHGYKKPPASIRVSIAKDEEGVATVKLKEQTGEKTRAQA